MWNEYSTYYQSQNPQLSEEWSKLRLCSLTASNASKWSGRSPYTISPDEDADIICGLKKEQFTDFQIWNMNRGSSGEKYIRDWYCNQIGYKVKEVGISVWKEDMRFRGSLDADTSNECFAEFKIPLRIYRPLIEHYEAVKKGFTPPLSYHSHIQDSHYDQIITNLKIHNRKYCDYIVSCKNNVYWDKVYMNHDHWNMLYEKGCEFYEKYITPRMIKHNLKRIDPI